MLALFLISLDPRRMALWLIGHATVFVMDTLGLVALGRGIEGLEATGTNALERLRQVQKSAIRV